jgi:hypothetical protein
MNSRFMLKEGFGGLIPDMEWRCLVETPAPGSFSFLV